MSDFLMKIFGKSLEKDLANSTEKNWLNAMLKNPVVKNLVRSNRKEIHEALTKGEQDLIATIEKIELLPGEAQAAPVIDIDFNESNKKEIRLIIAAFDENSAIVRVISDIPLRTFILNWINQKIK